MSRNCRRSSNRNFPCLNTLNRSKMLTMRCHTNATAQNCDFQRSEQRHCCDGHPSIKQCTAPCLSKDGDSVSSNHLPPYNCCSPCPSSTVSPKTSTVEGHFDVSKKKIESETPSPSYSPLFSPSSSFSSSSRSSLASAGSPFEFHAPDPNRSCLQCDCKCKASPRVQRPGIFQQDTPNLFPMSCFETDDFQATGSTGRVQRACLGLNTTDSLKAYASHRRLHKCCCSCL